MNFPDGPRSPDPEDSARELNGHMPRVAVAHFCWCLRLRLNSLDRVVVQIVEQRVCSGERHDNVTEVSHG